MRKKKINRVTLEKRILLEKYLKEGILPKSKIAAIIKISPSTVTTELKRCQGQYNAIEAQEDCEKKIRLQIEGLTGAANEKEVLLHGHRMPSQFIAIKTGEYYYMHDNRKRRDSFLGVARDRNDIPDFFEIII